MNLDERNRNAAIAVIRRIRSKAIDTEKLLLLDQIGEHQAIERAAQLEGLTHVLGMAILKDHEEAHISL